MFQISSVPVCMIIYISIFFYLPQITASSCIYGPGCILPCHCANNATCDSITGQCPAACDSSLIDDPSFDWTGPSCQLGNIARDKVTSSSTEYCVGCELPTGVANAFGSSLAVDGRSKNREHDPAPYFGNCASTHVVDDNTWWKVDFGTAYIVLNLTTIGHNDGWNPVFSLGYTASVGYNNREQMCATAKKPTSKPLKGSTIVSLSCVQPLVGQYLRISRAQSVIDSFQEDKQNSLILCEVIVWGVIATYIRQVPRTINQLQATDLNVQQLPATVQISWSVAFNDNLAALFYGYQVQYKCDNDNTWTNGSSVLASNIRTTIIAGLQRNVLCQVRIAPVGIQTYVVINDTPSAVTTFFLNCTSGTYAKNCTSSCGKCRNGSFSCNTFSGVCPGSLCQLWWTNDKCDVEIRKLSAKSVSAEQVNSTSIRISWVTDDTAIGQIYYYNLNYSSSDSTFPSNNVISHIRTSRQYHLSNLLPDTFYSISIQMCGEQYEENECSEIINVSPTKTLCGVPDAVEDIVTSSTLEATSDQVRWIIQWKWPINLRCSGTASFVINIEGALTQKKEVTTNTTTLVLPYSDHTLTVLTVNSQNVSSNFNKEFLLVHISDTQSLQILPIALGAGLGAGLAVIAIVILVVICTRKRQRKQHNPEKKAYPLSTNVADAYADVKVAAEKKIQVEDNYSDKDSEIENTYVNNLDIDDEDKINLIDIKNLRRKIREMQAKKQFDEEFATLPTGIDPSSPMTEACKSESKKKNRYNIKPYDFNRVILKADPHRKPPTYINASYIEGYPSKQQAYIATQAPKKESLEDFWHMVWQENSSVIVMLTNIFDNGKPQCEQYWPDDINAKQLYGPFDIILLSVDQYVNFRIRKLRMKNQNQERIVTQFHFTAWPDKNIPEHILPMVFFHLKVREEMMQNRGPTIVHCSAGAGRTGTFIALDYLHNQAKATGKVDVYTCVYKLRKQRLEMVQKLSQYEYLYQTLLYELYYMNNESLNLGDNDDEGNYMNVKGGIEDVGAVTEEFKLLSTLRGLTPPQVQSDSGKKNASRNRRRDVIPGDSCRVLLMTHNEAGNDYINAVFVDGVSHKDRFIITQSPFPITIKDFWFLVRDYNCRIIVSLDQIDGSSPDVPVFWPNASEPIAQGNMIITNVNSKEIETGLTVREFELSPVKANAFPQFMVHQIHASISSSASVADKLHLFGLVAIETDSIRVVDEQRILIHCRDGVSNSTVMCSLLYAIEHHKFHQQGNVFDAVQNIRLSRPQAIATADDYTLLHKLFQQYETHFSTYVN